MTKLAVIMSKRKGRAIVEALENIGLASLAREVKAELRRVEKAELVKV